jgi:hypothetical protein
MQTCVIFDNMMQIPTTHKRNLFYAHLTASVDAIQSLEGKNWSCIIYCKKFSAKAHTNIISQIIALKPLFVYAIGNNHPELEECIINELCEANEGFDDDTELPLTFGDNDLKGAIVFSLESAFHESKEIDEVVILDLNDEGLNEEDIKKLAQ